MIDEKKRKRYSDLVEILIVLGILFLLVSIFVPVEIWKEEDFYKDKSHFNMENLYSAEQFYHRLVGDYTLNIDEAVQVVDAIRDSLTADSTYLDNQVLHLNDTTYTVKIEPGFDTEFDTTFGFRKTRRDTIQDTTVTILKYDPEISRVDTNYIQKADLKKIKDDPNLREILGEAPAERVEVDTYYDSYQPDSSMLFCPLTGQIYNVALDEGKLRISSPIKGVFKEPRFGIFSFKATNHGYIEDGVDSWSKK